MMPEERPKAVEILECTLRDGSYAIDFKFTASDTAFLTRLLSKLGFRWIEVGHGWGLGASQAGRGQMPSSDEEMIRAAKATGTTARIGAFCIPGIASWDQLRSARSAGLDFVRIGVNAFEAEKAFPYLELAKKVGLIPFLNFMKTHAVPPAAFAENAKMAVECGAEVIYVVDSSGGMFPEEVASYFSALQERCPCRMGFHAHNNLQMAVANAIQAYRHGAEFIDATLHGLGRSAGNLPTEIAIAVFERLGARTGLDLLEVLEAAESYLGPLLTHIQLHDSLSVAMGYAHFHSSWLPKIKALAGRYRVDLRQLILALGKDQIRSENDPRIEEIASSLPVARHSASEEVLLSFAFPEVSQERVGASLQNVDSLIQGLTISAAKRKAKPALVLTATQMPADQLVLAEILLEDEEMMLGRVQYGSFSILEEVLDCAGERIEVFLFDRDGGHWAMPFPQRLLDRTGKNRTLVIHSRRLLELYLADLLTLAAHRYGRSSLLIYGNAPPSLLALAADLFECVLEDLSEAEGFGKRLDVILCLCPPGISEGKKMGSLLPEHGVLLCLGRVWRLEHLPELDGKKVVWVNPHHAYRGQARRWQHASELLPVSDEEISFA